MTCWTLGLYGAVVIAIGTVELYRQRAPAILLTTIGLVGTWLWLRWDGGRGDRGESSVPTDPSEIGERNGDRPANVEPVETR